MIRIGVYSLDHLHIKQVMISPSIHNWRITIHLYFYPSIHLHPSTTIHLSYSALQINQSSTKPLIILQRSRENESYSTRILSLPLRLSGYPSIYARFWVGVGLEDCSATEDLHFRRFLYFLWFLGEKVELSLVAAVCFLCLNLDRFHLRSVLFLLLARRRFSFTLLGRQGVSPSGIWCDLARSGVSRFSSFSSGAGFPYLARVCVGGSIYHDSVSSALSLQMC